MRIFAALIGLILAGAGGPAAAQNYNQVIAFGDSTIDTGWFATLAKDTPPLGAPGNVAGGTGNAGFDFVERTAVSLGGNTHSTGPGPGNAQILAAFFGLTANAANTPGGTNFAISGATDSNNFNFGFGVTNIGETGGGGFTNIGQLPSTAQQIGNYLTSVGGRANPNALYSFSTGGNDVFIATAIAAAAGNNPLVVAGLENGPLSAEASNLATAVSTLQKDGARYIIVTNEYATVSSTPTQNQLGAFLLGNSNPAAGPVSMGATWSDLKAAGVNFIPADTQTLIRVVENNLSAFGILFPITSFACTPGAKSGFVGATGYGAICVNATAAQLNAAGLGALAPFVGTLSTGVTATGVAQSYTNTLFMDGVHLTEAGQKIWADYEYSLLTAPSQISFLAENAVKTRLTLVSNMQDQINLSLSHRGPQGINAWVSGDVGAMSMKNFHGFPDDPNTVYNGAAGVDFAFAPGMIAGIAASAETLTAALGQFGHFRQQGESLSLYAGYNRGPLWGNVIGTYGHLGFDVNRVVPIGITMQANNGNTGGDDWSAAFQGGYKFWTQGITHGPIVGFVLQDDHVGGFTESGSFTSLGFGSQTRDSAVGQFGYKATLEYWANLQPFGQLTWNHEFANTNRNVTASLTTTVAPSFSLPAVLLGKDWGEVKGGFAYNLGGGGKVLVTGSADFAQSSATVYGAQVGLNLAF